MSVLATINRPVGIRQEIKAGNQFDGSLPEDGGSPLIPGFLHDTFVYAAGDKGGLFDPTDTHMSFAERAPLIIAGIEILLADQTDWQLDIIDPFGTAITMLAGGNDESYFEGSLPGVIILWGTKFKLITVGATQAMVATIKLAPLNIDY